MQSSPNLSQAEFRPGSRTKFIGRGFISPRLGISTHHSAESGPLPRRAVRWVMSLLTKFSGSFEKSQNGRKPRVAARRSPGQALATSSRWSPTTAKNWLRRCNRFRLLDSSDSANDCCANPVFKKSPLLAGPETAASMASACFRSTPSSASKSSFSARSTLDRVTPSHVRDFRGAMTGRADKGIIITTGSFTSEARKEAVRERSTADRIGRWREAHRHAGETRAWAATAPDIRGRRTVLRGVQEIKRSRLALFTHDRPRRWPETLCIAYPTGNNMTRHAML